MRRVSRCPTPPELQAHFGQPGQQKKGCGFPVAHLLMLFNARTGLAVDAITAPLHTHEMSLASGTHQRMAQGDLVVGDDSFGSYPLLALLAGRGMFGLFPAHHVRIVDFTPNRPCIEPRKVARAKEANGLPRSRWVKSLGENDQIVEWFKPAARPKWMTRGAVEAATGNPPGAGSAADDPATGIPSRDADDRDHAFGPDEISRRRTVYATSAPMGRGDRYSPFEDDDTVPELPDALQDCRRHAQGTVDVPADLQSDSSGDGVGGKATEGGSEPDQLRQRLALDALRREGDTLARLAVVPSRPNRREPRVIKRRPKPYDLMTRPRKKMRDALRAAIGVLSSG